MTSLFNSKCKPCFIFDNGAVNFMSALCIRFRIANSCTRWCRISESLKGFRKMWDGRIFLKTSVPLSKDLSNEPNFSRINLAGRWTVGTPTKHQVSKRQFSKRLVSKRPVSKRQVYKTSGLQKVRFQNVCFQNVQF